MHIPRSLLVVCLLILVLASGCNWGNASTPLSAAKSALRLLQAKDYEGLVNQFMEPELLAKELNKNGSIEKVAERVARVADRIETALAEAVKTTPKYSEDGSRAVFELSNPLHYRDEITFIKIGDRWYIEN